MQEVKDKLHSSVDGFVADVADFTDLAKRLALPQQTPEQQERITDFMLKYYGEGEAHRQKQIEATRKTKARVQYISIAGFLFCFVSSGAAMLWLSVNELSPWPAVSLGGFCCSLLVGGKAASDLVKAFTPRATGD